MPPIPASSRSAHPRPATPAAARRWARTLAALLIVPACGVLASLLLVSAHAVFAAEGERAGDVGPEPSDVRRVVSLNPSLTAIAIALGARDRLIAIDDYSARLEPALDALPRVGGLHSPNLEAVVALEPDVVVLVPSVAQRDFRGRLEALGIRVEVFENTRFDQVLENIERMGGMLGREAEAAARIAAIEGARGRAAAVGADRGAPKVALVIQREPLYVVGRGSFLSEMLAMLGARSLGDVFDEPYPRVDVEWLVASAPDVIVDLTEDPSSAERHWQRFPSMPAVKAGRVHAVPAALVSLPGPDLDRALATLAGALYGDDAARAVAGAVAGHETSPSVDDVASRDESS
ncbi:MAG: helical backbone metal receptor [Actinomycetota bacterium]|nr:helical backbone metal receptor [Actinomycetota bacterium]